MREKELMKNGYRLYDSCNYKSQAMECAKGLREEGYRATVTSCATLIRGIRIFSVFYKEK